jgi:hypothetical protein
VLIPKGLFELDEDSSQEKFSEDFVVPGTEELKSLEVWAHRHTHILKAGRVTHQEPLGIAEEEKEEFIAKLQESDPIVDKYRALNEDTPITGLEIAWLSKLVGDSQPYN